MSFGLASRLDTGHLHEMTGNVLMELKRGRMIDHLHLRARDRATVERWYTAGLAAGGRDNGAPGERPYHPGYYAAFLLDPDGNNVEAVYHGPSKRSAEAVTITT